MGLLCDSRLCGHFSGAGFSDSNYFLAYSILVIITFLYASWKGNQVRTENYRTIVEKMLPSFRKHGFELVYSASNNWLWDSDRVMTLYKFSDMEATAQDSEESERAPFQLQPEYWKPLEGRWERDSSRSQNMVPDMVFKISSFAWDFGNASAEEDFWGLNEMRGFFSCFYPKDTLARYYAKGNALEFQPEETGQSKLFVRLKSQSIIEPIPSNGPVYYFRKGPSHTFQVDGNTMKIYVFEFQEDIPKDADLLAGALDNLPADGSCGSCYCVLERAKSVANPVTIV